MWSPEFTRILVHQKFCQSGRARRKILQGVFLRFWAGFGYHLCTTPLLGGCGWVVFEGEHGLFCPLALVSPQVVQWLEILEVKLFGGQFSRLKMMPSLPSNAECPINKWPSPTKWLFPTQRFSQNLPQSQLIDNLWTPYPTEPLIKRKNCPLRPVEIAHKGVLCVQGNAAQEISHSFISFLCVHNFYLCAYHHAFASTFFGEL